MNKKVNWTEQDLDAILESVEQTLSKAETLAKSKLRKDQDGDQDDAQSPDQMSAQPPQEDEQPEGQPGQEQELEGESDAPLSDEELQQIYGSMDPQELERHFSIIRQALSQSYGDQGQDQAAPAPEAPVAPQAAPAPAPEENQAPPDFEKSEKVIALEKKVAEQAQALEQITKAFEVLAKPTRKSITEIQVMEKGEITRSTKPMSKDEIRTAYMKLPTSSLSKHERDAVNRFFLYGEGQQDIEKLINSKGGK
jgi:hypothetical protein